MYGLRGGTANTELTVAFTRNEGMPELIYRYYEYIKKSVQDTLEMLGEL